MNEPRIGTCRFCGTCQIINSKEANERTADDWATAMCTCAQAGKERDRIDKMRRAITVLRSQSDDETFGSVADDVAMPLIALTQLAGDRIERLSVTLGDGTVYTVNSHGNVKRTGKSVREGVAEPMSTNDIVDSMQMMRTAQEAAL